MTSSNGNIFRVTGPLCGEFTGPGEFPTQRPVTRSFDVFFDVGLNKWLSKQPWGWWFETPSWSLLRQCNVKHLDPIKIVDILQQIKTDQTVCIFHVAYCKCDFWLVVLSPSQTLCVYDDVIKRKHFPHYWPFVRGIHRSPVNSPHKGQWRGTDVFFDLILIKRLRKQWWGWWYETPSRPLWRHCSGMNRWPVVFFSAQRAYMCLYMAEQRFHVGRLKTTIMQKVGWRKIIQP